MTRWRRGSTSCKKADWKLAESCADDEYLDDRDADKYNHTCQRCGEGAYCVGAIRVAEIMAKFGFGRCPLSAGAGPQAGGDGEAAVVPRFEACPFSAACLGGANPVLESKYNDLVVSAIRKESCNTAAGYRPASGVANASSFVNATTANFLCGACAPGYSHAAGDLTGKCYKCPEQGANVALVILVCFVAIVGAVMYVKITMGDGGDHDAADGAKSIGLSFVQVITLLMTFPVAWPSAFSWVFQIGGVFTVMGQHWINVKCPTRLSPRAKYFIERALCGLCCPVHLFRVHVCLGGHRPLSGRACARDFAKTATR